MADVARRVVRMLEGSLGREDVHIELHTASVRVDAAVATPLAVVLNELIQNAVEHGLGDGPGTVSVGLRGGDDRPVELQVHDDGAGAPDPAGPGVSEPHPPEAGAPGREGSRAADRGRPAVHSPGGTGFSGVHSLEGGLGLRLVRALVEEELRGQFTLTHPAGRGSIATATIPPVERAG
jgi:two-component sensor histidine kinase